MLDLGSVRLSVLVAAILLGASSAQAFTIASTGATGGDSTTLVDPDEQLQVLGNGGAQAVQEGGRSIQFGVAPSFGSGPTSSLVGRPQPEWLRSIREHQ